MDKELRNKGVILGVIFAAVLVLIDAHVPAPVGLVIAVLLSLGIGLLTFTLADRSFDNIDAN